MGKSEKIPRITEKEIALIKSAQSGNEKAFNKLFYMYKGFVEALLTDYLKDRDEARDITNVVFLKVHNKLSMFVDYDSFGGWLRILTRNTAIDYLRTIKEKQQYVEPTSYKLDSNVQNREEFDLINQMTLDSILSKLDKMTETKKKVLQMFYGEGYTINDISKCIGMPKGSIKSILFRFRQQVFKQFNLK